MKVLARIPALDADGASGPHAADAIAAEAPQQHDADRLRSSPAPFTRRRAGRRPRSRFPTASIMALAVLASIAWSLASWNDARRAERSRQERLARMHPPVSSSGTVSR